jgi:hypothetical protein
VAIEDTLKRLSDLVGWKEREDDEEGIPPGMNLGDLHEQLQEKVEAGELAMNGLVEKHKELMKQVRRDEEPEKEDAMAEVDDAEIAAVATEQHQDAEKIARGPIPVGPLRGMNQLRETAARIGKGNGLSQVVANNPSVRVVHGFGNLPTFVKVNVFLLTIGVIFAIIKSAGTGRAFKTNSRKREL